MPSSNPFSNINNKSVWLFTKQETSFEQSLKAVKLFDEIPNREDANIESYLEEHAAQYGLTTDNHRMLVIPQFYGLITKTPFYSRVPYNKEKPTAVYDEIKSLTEQNKINTLITEQLLKVKIHAIIDNANNNTDYYILPIIFIYKVLKELKENHGINSISKEYLLLYVMTCKKYSDWETSVSYISQNPTITARDRKLAKEMNGASRILTMIKKNIKLFKITQTSISINPQFDEYFYNNFMLQYDIEELHETLKRDADYSYFLYNIQNFNINLIDVPDSTEVTENTSEETVTEPRKIKEIIPTENSEEELDDDYIKKIEKIKESNVNPDAGKDSFKQAPILKVSEAVSKKYKRNPLLGRIAIQKACYLCEANAEHVTFESAKTHKYFMEAHHLVPVKYQKEIWEQYGINVDCPENIVSLCPICHRAFHNGTKEVKKQIIDNLYEHLSTRYQEIGFNISVEDIERLYGVR